MILHKDADHATAWVGFPVFPLSRLLLALAQLAPPAQLLKQYMIKLRVACSDVGTLGVGPIFGKQTGAIALHTEIGTEISTAVHDMFGGVIQVG